MDFSVVRQAVRSKKLPRTSVSRWYKGQATPIPRCGRPRILPDRTDASSLIVWRDGSGLT